MDWLILLLVLMIPTIFGIAHVYGSYAQDARKSVVVQLRQRTDFDRLVDRHQRECKVELLQKWSTATASGYRGIVPGKLLERISADPDVERVDVLED